MSVREEVKDILTVNSLGLHWSRWAKLGVGVLVVLGLADLVGWVVRVLSADEYARTIEMGEWPGLREQLHAAQAARSAHSKEPA